MPNQAMVVIEQKGYNLDHALVSQREGMSPFKAIYIGIIYVSYLKNENCWH